MIGLQSVEASWTLTPGQHVLPSADSAPSAPAGSSWRIRRTRCTTADSNGRVSVVARVGPPGIALFSSASLTSARKPHAGPGSVPASAQRNPTLKRRSESVEFPGGRVPRRSKQDKALSGLSRGTVGSELVEIVGGAARAPAAVANPRVFMMPGGHIAPNALRPLRRPRSRRPWPGPGRCSRFVVASSQVVSVKGRSVSLQNRKISERTGPVPQGIAGFSGEPSPPDPRSRRHGCFPAWTPGNRPPSTASTLYAPTCPSRSSAARAKRLILRVFRLPSPMSRHAAPSLRRSRYSFSHATHLGCPERDPTGGISK